MAERMINSNAAGSPVLEGYASVNGINLYYEIYGPIGVDTPLLLLHGGLGAIDMFAAQFAGLAPDRQLIGVELQAHAHTADINRPMRYEDMADDVAALVAQLGLDRADICGYSLGGGVALQTAIRHPDVVRKLVIISAPARRSGWYPEVLAGMAAMNADSARAWVGSPMQQAYARVAPRPEDWPVLVTKVGQLLKQDYDWSAQIARLKSPALVVAGDADAVRTAHAVELFGLFGGGKVEAGLDRSGMVASRLAILPAASHYDILSSPYLNPAVAAFLDSPLHQL